MKKTYKLTGLDCANCARKIQEQISKLPGVEEAAVSFLTQKMTLTCEDARLDETVKEAARIMKRIEPDCTIVM